MPRTHFDTPVDEYERQRAGHFGRRRFELVDEFVSGIGGTVVELGCGPGPITRELASRHPDTHFVGVDLEPRMIEYASQAEDQPANAEWRCADLTDRPLPQPADLLFSIDVIHHFPDHLKAFQLVRRSLKQGGRWLAVEPNIWNPYITASIWRMKRKGYDEDHFRPRQLLPLLRLADFRVVSKRYLHAFPSGVRQLSPRLARAERFAERLPIVGGSVVYELLAV